MILRTPSFYHRFQCIADKCTDTCCVGWEIDVDQKSLDKYTGFYNGQCGKERQEFARQVLQNIEDGHFILKPGDRCPFLKENGLCEMICKLGCNGTDMGPDGESVLCDICREHPRFVEVYGDIMEKGIGLCCEEGVRLLLTSPTFPLCETEIDDLPDEMPEGAEEARDAIFQEREAIFALLADRSKPLNQRLLEVLDFAEAVSDCENREEAETSPSCHPERSTKCVVEGSRAALPPQWLTVLNEGESYGPAWDAAFLRMQDPRTSPALFTEEDGARIITYLIFRYYAKSLFDGDSLTKVQFAIFFWIILQNFGEELSFPDSFNKTCDDDPALSKKINAIKLLSKQTEYSEEVMEILADNFYSNPAFSVEQFRNILTHS